MAGRTACCVQFLCATSCLRLFHREERESWIRAKYEQRAFVPALQPPPGAPPPEGGMPAWLLSAVTERDLPRLLLLLAHSTKEQINRQPAGPELPPRTALHAACQLGDVVMTQLLVWVGPTLFHQTCTSFISSFSFLPRDFGKSHGGQHW